MKHIRWLALFCLLLFTSGCTKKEVSITKEQAYGICKKELASRNIDRNSVMMHVWYLTPHTDLSMKENMEEFLNKDDSEHIKKVNDFIENLRNGNYWLGICLGVPHKELPGGIYINIYINAKNGDVLYLEKKNYLELLKTGNSHAP